MLAAASLGKRPIKMPNLKSLKLFPSYELVKGFRSKCTVFKVDLISDHQIYSLQDCMYALVTEPGNVTGWGSEGVKPNTYNTQTPCYLADLSEDADVADKDDGDREEEGQSHLVQVGVKHHVDSFVVPVTQAVAPVRHHHYEAEHLWT